MQRPFEKHIDGEELEALLRNQSASESQHSSADAVLHADAINEAERHVAACPECQTRIEFSKRVDDTLSTAAVRRLGRPGPDCPRDEDVEWHEVAAGLWPEEKTRRLLMHAALCDYCGPRLRAATSVEDDATTQEEALLAQIRPPSRPEVDCLVSPRADSAHPSQARSWFKWLVPVLALGLILGAIVTLPRWQGKMSGAKYAEFAVNTHRQRMQGRLPLDVRADSEQTLNAWMKDKVPFALALPASTPLPGEERPYRLEGASLVPVRDKKAIYIAYMMHSGPTSLVVTSDSAADADGGVVVDYSKVSFHYRMVEGFKVVTWSLKGKSYALVSGEGNNTQQSCMICHSPMRDRDLTKSKTPLRSTAPKI